MKHTVTNTISFTQINHRVGDHHKARAARSGKVWLVGAGPGDADLLTVKALSAINSADIIFYDQLVSEEICALFPKNTPALYVGKVKNNHSIPQEDLNQLLISQAQSGLTVCRIKGGDPFVFGRGGEELLELRKAGIEAEVIPGITSASGCSTYANIPLTHRGLSQGCTFVTGHAEKTLDVNWNALAQLNHTLVFYMAAKNITDLAELLLRYTRRAQTPLAVIEQATTVHQQVHITSLQNCAEDFKNKQFSSPSLVIVGDVVNLHKQFNWFGSNQATGTVFNELAIK